MAKNRTCWWRGAVQNQALAVISHEHHGNSNHYRLGCLINSLLRLTTKKILKTASLVICVGNPLDFSTEDHITVIMGSIAPQITSLTIVYSSVNSGADQRKHQSSASLAFVRGIHRRPGNSLHKGPVTWKMFPFDDVIMGDSESISMSWWHHQGN